MTIDEIIKDLQKLRDEQFKIYESYASSSRSGAIALGKADGLTTAISKLIQFRAAATQEQKQ